MGAVKKPPRKRSTELVPADLRWTLEEDLLGNGDTGRIRPAEGTIGQERAVRALRLGLQLRSRGFNVFVAGPDGTGRSTTAKAIIEEIRKTACPVMADRCYVNNFRDVDRPRLLVFPKGRGRQFRKDMDELIQRLRQALPALLESEEFKRSLTGVVEQYRKREGEVLGTFEKKIKKEGFAFAQLKMGNVTVPDLLPIVRGKPMPMEKVTELAGSEELPAKEAEAIAKAYEALHDEFEAVLRRAREVAREMQKGLEQIERDACDKIIRGHISDLKAANEDEEVRGYLDEVHKSLLDNLILFKPEQAIPVPEPLAGLVGSAAPKPSPFVPYQVNVILDSTERDGCPVEVPESVSYLTLFGAIEMDIFRSGAMHTDFTRIKAGALLRADGGFLVLEALEMLRSPGVYPALKRVLKTGRLEIELPEGPILTPALAMRPEPIELDVKVVLVGEARLYDTLAQLDDEFTSVFKVKAEFDSDMKNTPENRRHYVRVLAKIGRNEKLPPMDRDAVAEIVEHGVRLAGRRTRISTQFNDVADLYREAAHRARTAGQPKVGAARVREAEEALRDRHGLPEERVREHIESGVIMIEVDGEKVGQVNGLAVYDLGQTAFGKPSRITAVVSLGRAGIVNIEREAGLSGKIHDKGVFILSSFLRERFGQRLALSLTASLCFEQSYGGVEGDSASSTELYALLSALSGIPIRQGIAVTGSVDQRGRIQPIGGANEKIEGFFDVCWVKGLSGRQGVMIPRSNVDDLMLRRDVVEAVRRGTFRVWAVESVEEGIEVLTGVPWKGVAAKVEKRLKEMATLLAKSEKGGRA